MGSWRSIRRRVIVLDHERGHAHASGPFAAGVGVAMFGPDQARYGVEQIAVQSDCAEDSLPSIVRRLLRGDVPTSVWWTEDLSRVPPITAIVDDEPAVPLRQPPVARRPRRRVRRWRRWSRTNAESISPT